ncbi:MAG: sugar transporter, ATP-binding protein [Cryobacterium sp.]|jgi:ribose transport system ATP-binding protein|nr:sugar transporter, ATP-binding protein [Cryobacterium sp.]
MNTTAYSTADTTAKTAANPVELADISKRFGGTQALNHVSLALAAGEVHALVGENGAGKSTLGKIIAGLYTPDAGTLSIDGSPVTRWDPVRAQHSGIVMIAQELSLVRQLTVEQNVFLGVEQNRMGVMRRNLSERFAELQEIAHFGLNPKARVGDLRLADQQKIEIMRALARDARVIVMDEPTSSLTAHETSQLHELIRRLRDQGRSVVYVSHFLDAVLEVGDTVTIMRDGNLVRTSPIRDETKKSIVEGMLGRELAVTFPERPAPPPATTPPILTTSGLSSDAGISDVSITVRPGEIVGLLGLVGSGRSEIARAIVGADRLTGGTITFNGTRLHKPSPRRSTELGIVLVPEDRHGQGLVLERSVKENVSLPFLDRFSRFGVLRGGMERTGVTKMVTDLNVRPPRIGLTIQGLSGGNQQKALLAKWLIGDPKFVILDEPTRGVDIGAKLTIYELIVALAERGIGVLLISSEHEEVLALSNRAYLVSRGRIAGEVDPTVLSTSELLGRLFSVDEEEEKELIP